MISCGPNGDKPEGKLSGNITCERKFFSFGKVAMWRVLFHSRCTRRTHQRTCLSAFTDALELIMAATSCGALVVPYSNHKDGHHKNSITYDTVNVICDHGYVGGQSTAVCSPDGLGQSKWTQYKACQGSFEIHCFSLALLYFSSLTDV